MNMPVLYSQYDKKRDQTTYLLNYTFFKNVGFAL